MSARGLRYLLGLTITGILVIGSPFATTAAHAEGCPNETLRTELGSSFLPDCRAYEMVSPPYKEGYPMFVSSFSSDGEKAIIYGLGNLAGTQGAGESVLQGEDIWTVEPVRAGNSLR